MTIPSSVLTFSLSKPRGSDPFSEGPDPFSKAPDRVSKGPDRVSKGPYTVSKGPDTVHESLWVCVSLSADLGRDVGQGMGGQTCTNTRNTSIPPGVLSFLS